MFLIELSPKKCDKAVDNYTHPLEFAPDCYKTDKMCEKAVNTSFIVSFLFLADIGRKICVKELFLKIPLC